MSTRPLPAGVVVPADRLHSLIVHRPGFDEEGHSMQCATFIVLVFLGVLADVAWAGPAEDIAAIGQRRGQAFAAGDVDGMTADFADNAGFIGLTGGGFRVEGKQGIRTYFTEFFKNYPQRSVVGRGAVTRVYAGETVAVVNSYADLTVVDRGGHVTTYPYRASMVWMKLDGRWQIVDVHNSVVPGAR
jgi:uncharacterized protein (TIGR02246 family)